MSLCTEGFFYRLWDVSEGGRGGGLVRRVRLLTRKNRSYAVTPGLPARRSCWGNPRISNLEERKCCKHAIILSIRNLIFMYQILLETKLWQCFSPLSIPSSTLPLSIHPNHPSLLHYLFSYTCPCILPSSFYSSLLIRLSLSC